MKSPIIGKLGPWPISKSPELQFYTSVLELGPLKYLVPRRFPNRDNRRTEKLHNHIIYVYTKYRFYKKRSFYLFLIFNR